MSSSSLSEKTEIIIQLADPANDEMIRQMLEIYRPFIEKPGAHSSTDNIPIDSNTYIPWVTSYEEELPSLEEFRGRVKSCLDGGYIWMVALLPIPGKKHQQQQNNILDCSIDANTILPGFHSSTSSSSSFSMQNFLVLGYSYCGAFRSRAAYRISAETTVYTYQHKTHQTFPKHWAKFSELLAPIRGVGKILYEILFLEMKKAGFETAIASCAFPNPLAIRAHQDTFKFKSVGIFENVANKWGISLGVHFFQKDLRENHHNDDLVANKNAGRVIRCDVQNFLPRSVYV